MSGVKVGEHGLVGSMGVASKDVDPFPVVGGIPAKTIKIKSIAPKNCGSHWRNLSRSHSPAANAGTTRNAGPRVSIEANPE